MCCPTTPNTRPRIVTTMATQDCGCGCIGTNPGKVELEKYRDHLKVELNSVDKQIKELEKK